ncbi:MAG TPA: hypothetical protein VEF72_04930 [Mycobacterium sp.]|nr:hypothetical protein [Mycobacterium sp.]
MLNHGTQPDMLGSLTAAQRSIWAAQQLRPEVPYNFAAFVVIDHDVDAERLTVACEAAATRFGTRCARLSLDDEIEKLIRYLGFVMHGMKNAKGTVAEKAPAPTPSASKSPSAKASAATESKTHLTTMSRSDGQ